MTSMLFYIKRKEKIAGDGARHLYLKIKLLFIRFKLKLSYKHNKIVLTDKRGERYVTARYITKKLGIKITFNGDYNTVILNHASAIKGSNLCFNGDKSTIEFKGQNKGQFSIHCYNNNNKVIIGKATKCCSLFISAINNEIIIGDNCMISNNVVIWGDGHSVIDVNTKECINVPKSPITIGNHVWIGERVTITKNANIPDDCIVGITSTVTKGFSEPNCLIAGNPAQIKKHGITWNGQQPLAYDTEWKHTIESTMK